jgi:hypothetical protein
MERVHARRSAVSVTVLLGAAVALSAGCRSTTSPSATASPAAAPAAMSASSPSNRVAAIADGRYLGTRLSVADIQRLLEADTTLSTAQKNEILDTILDIRGATTLQTLVEIRNGTEFAATSRTDAEPFPAFGDGWPMVSLERTVLVGTGCCGEEAFRVSNDPGGLTLTFISPASGPTETFVRHVLFELPTFSPAPAGS